MQFGYASLPDRSITSPKSYLYHNDIQRERYQFTFNAPFSELFICGRTADADKFGVAIGGLYWRERDGIQLRSRPLVQPERSDVWNLRSELDIQSRDENVPISTKGRGPRMPCIDNERVNLLQPRATQRLLSNVEMY